MESRKLSQIELMDGINHVWYWRSGGQSFQCSFMALIAKADKINRERLAMSYPHLVEAYLMWDKAKDEDAFFEHYGMSPVNKSKK